MIVLSILTAITASTMTLFIFSNLVAGGGWYLDPDSCRPVGNDQRTYQLLTAALKRANVAHSNLGTIFGTTSERSQKLQQLILQVLGGPNPDSADDAIRAAKAMFSGGYDPTSSANPPRYLYGLRTVQAELSEVEVTYNPSGVVARQCLSHKLRLRR